MKWQIRLSLLVLGCAASCASQAPQQSKNLSEITEKVKRIEAENTRQAARIEALETQLASQSAAPSVSDADLPGSRPLLRVVRLEPSAASRLEPAVAAAGEGPADSEAEHVLLSGTGSDLRAETLVQPAAAAVAPEKK